MTKSMRSYRKELKGKIKFDAWYQRPEVWSMNKKQKLIDSLINGYDIGIIYLREIEDAEYKYEVLDGQQRLRSIDQFIDGDYKTDPTLARDINKIGFDELRDDNELFPQWEAKSLHFQKITRGDDRAVADFFLRLQEGMDLNTPEILNAIIGEMRDRVIDLSEHRFFDNLGISNKRYRRRLLTAQAFNIEINGDFQNRSFPSMGRKALRRMYENHRDQVSQVHRNAVEQTLNLLHDIFDDPSFIQNQGDFLPIYMLVRYLKQNYSINGQEDSIGEFVRDFLSKVENVDVQDTLDVTPEERPYYNYRDARMSGALSSESFKIRFNVILGQYLEEHPALNQKDEQRAFDYGQRLAMFQRDDRVCQECGEMVNFGNAEGHHVQPYENGGQTTVDNGALVHSECHQRGIP
jgi:hypothetical protein